MISMVSSASIFFRDAPEKEGICLNHIVVLEDNGNDEEKYLVDEADDGRDAEDERFVPDDTRQPD